MPTVYIYYRLENGDTSGKPYRAKMKLNLEPVTSIGTYSYYIFSTDYSWIMHMPPYVWKPKFLNFLTEFESHFYKKLNIGEITDSSNAIISSSIDTYNNLVTYNYEIESIKIEDPENCIVPIKNYLIHDNNGYVFGNLKTFSSSDQVIDEIMY